MREAIWKNLYQKASVIGPEAIGPKAVGPEAVGPEAIGPEAVKAVSPPQLGAVTLRKNLFSESFSNWA